MATTPPEAEKAGSEATPPPAESTTATATAPETFSHAEPASSSSFPLLRKLRLRPKWREKWSRKGKQPDNEAQQEEQDDEEEEEEEEEDDESIVIEELSGSGSGSRSRSRSRLRSRSRSSGSYASYMYSDSDSDSSDDDSRWKTLWRTVRRFLPVFNGSFIPLIGYHHVLMTISSVAIILLSLLVAGCSSHRMNSIYLLELSYHHQPVNSSLEHGVAALNPSFYSLVANLSSGGDLAVRVGYFGICIATNSEGDPQTWSCRRKANDLAGQVTATQDPLNLLAIGDNFRDQVIVSVIVIMSAILIFLGICGLGTFPGWREDTNEDGEEIEVKPFPSQMVAHLVLGVNLLAALFLMVGILWQHVAAVAHAATTEAAFNGAVRGDVGAVAMGLGWGGIGASLLVTVGVGVMIASIRLLGKLLDED